MPDHDTRKRAQSFRLEYMPRKQDYYCILEIYREYFCGKPIKEQVNNWNQLKQSLIERTNKITKVWEGFNTGAAHCFYYISGYRSGSSAFLNLLQKNISEKRWTTVLIDALKPNGEVVGKGLFNNDKPWKSEWQPEGVNDSGEIVNNIKSSIKQLVEPYRNDNPGAMIILDHLDVWLLSQWRNKKLSSRQVCLLRQAWMETMNDYNLQWKNNNICFVATLMIPIHYSLGNLVVYDKDKTSTSSARDIWADNDELYIDGGYAVVFGSDFNNHITGDCICNKNRNYKCNYRIAKLKGNEGVAQLFESVYEVCKVEPWLMIAFLAWAKSDLVEGSTCENLDENVKAHYVNRINRSGPLIDDFFEGLALYVAKYAKEECTYENVKQYILDNIRGAIIDKINGNAEPLKMHIMKEDFKNYIIENWDNTFGLCVSDELIGEHAQTREEFIKSLIDIMKVRGILLTTKGAAKTEYQINPVLCYLHSDCKIFNIENNNKEVKQ